MRWDDFRRSDNVEDAAAAAAVAASDCREAAADSASAPSSFSD